MKEKKVIQYYEILEIKFPLKLCVSDCGSLSKPAELNCYETSY